MVEMQMTTSLSHSKADLPHLHAPNVPRDWMKADVSPTLKHDIAVISNFAVSLPDEDWPGPSQRAVINRVERVYHI
jgi:hypothetical protein